MILDDYLTFSPNAFHNQKELHWTFELIKVCWHPWFQEEVLTTTEPFHWTKGSFDKKKKVL